MLHVAVPAAIKAGPPGIIVFRASLRDALENVHELVGCQGIINTSPTDYGGMDKRSRDCGDQRWRLVVRGGELKR